MTEASTFVARRAARAAIAASALVAVVLVLSAGGGGRTVRAEFTDARGLLTGNRVLLNGATVGSVSSISLTDRGTAIVTFQLNPGIDPPRADAAATIRPVDLLGDIYLSYSPGTSARPLVAPIALSHTENLPRLSDLLLAFTPDARAGAQALIGELAQGLMDRGFDLNKAALGMRSALAAGDRLTAALGSQNATLGGLIDNAGGLASELATHRVDLSKMIGSFAQTLATTAAHAPMLDRGLNQLAPTISELGATTGQLADTANALQPVAVQLGAATPGLTVALRRLQPFLAQARSVVALTHPALRTAATFLAAGPSTFDPLTRGLGAGLSVASQSNAMLQMLVAAAPSLSKTFFDNVASEALEPGNQPLDPTNDPLRNYWRGAAVLSCQTFGLAIKPGCLTTYLNDVSASRLPAVSVIARPAKTSPAATPRATPVPAALPTGNRPPVASSAGPLSRVLPAVTGALANLPGAVSKITGIVSKVLSPGSPPPPSSGASPSGLQHLLKYLMGQ
jgi:phospholipid/cholesterol/gamma-HCH transport system substrate-binding protein